MSYGQTKKELEVKTDKKYIYSIEMTHNITTINSAYIKVKFFFIVCKENLNRRTLRNTILQQIDEKYQKN